MKYLDYKTRRDHVATQAWEIWTQNGRDLDIKQRETTTKYAQDAADNAYIDGITDMQWLDAVIAAPNGGASER
jgi:hypothetical protein